MSQAKLIRETLQVAVAAALILAFLLPAAVRAADGENKDTGFSQLEFDSAIRSKRSAGPKEMEDIGQKRLIRPERRSADSDAVRSISKDKVSIVTTGQLTGRPPEAAPTATPAGPS